MKLEPKREPHVEVPEGLVDALEHELSAVVAEGRTLTYAEMTRRVAVPPPFEMRKVMLALEQLATRHHRAGRPLLAALVVSRTREGIPAPGFFAHLTRIGAYQGPEEGPAARAWHESEVARCRAAAEKR